MSKNGFKFYAPLEIKKSKDKEGLEIMKMGGIASTMDEDSDGEFLDPEGFILDDFLSVGFVNWHHGAKNKPTLIVGEPTLAEIRKDGLYVECELYGSNPTAKEIYDTAEMLAKDSKTRRLGFSIEGEVIERGSEDENDPKFNIVKKANITGLAITHMPKNAKTFAEIIKGFTGEEGNSISNESEGLNTKKDKSIIKESVNKKLKNIVSKSKFVIKDLHEEAMYDTIFETFTDISIEKAEKLNYLLTVIRTDMSKGKITEDKLEKAMEALGLPVDASNPFLSKAKEDEDDSDDAEGRASKIADEVAKELYGDKSKGDETEKAKGAEDEEDEEEDEDQGIEKSKSSESLGNPSSTKNPNKVLYSLLNKEISKSKAQSTSENRALGIIMKSILEDNESLKGQFSAQNQLIKAQGEIIEKSLEAIENLTSVIENFGSTPNGRKSITKGFTERFNETPTDNSKVLSKSRDKAKIVSILDSNTFAKGYDEEFSKATTSFEASGTLSPAISARLQTENGITIVD